MCVGHDVVGEGALPIGDVEHRVGVVHGADGLPLLLNMLTLANVREVLIHVVARHARRLDQAALVLRSAVLRYHRCHDAIL